MKIFHNGRTKNNETKIRNSKENQIGKSLNHIWQNRKLKYIKRIENNWHMDKTHIIENERQGYKNMTTAQIQKQMMMTSERAFETLILSLRGLNSLFESIKPFLKVGPHVKSKLTNIIPYRICFFILVQFQPRMV